MMKFTFILCAVLLAVVPQNSQAYSLGELLESAERKTESIIDDTLFKAGEVVDSAKAETANLGEQLRQKVTEFLKKVENRVDGVMQQISHKVDEIIGDRNDPNLSECRRLAGTVRDTALAVIENETHCVTDKLTTGKGYVANISVVADEVIGQLKALQTEARQCAGGVDGVKTTLEAIACVNKVGFRAVWISAKRIPEVTANAVKLGFLVNTLPFTLPQCAAKNGFDTLVENVDTLFSGVKQCVEDRIGGEKHPQPEVTEVSKVTVSSTTEVTDFPEVEKLTTTETV